MSEDSTTSVAAESAVAASSRPQPLLDPAKGRPVRPFFVGIWAVYGNLENLPRSHHRSANTCIQQRTCGLWTHRWSWESKWENGTMNWGAFFLNPSVVWITIPVAYILISGIQELCRQYYEHQERLAMIQQGIVPPDRAPEKQDCCG